MKDAKVIFALGHCLLVSASALVIIKRSRIHVPAVKPLRLPPKFPGEDLSKSSNITVLICHCSLNDVYVGIKC